MAKKKAVKVSKKSKSIKKSKTAKKANKTTEKKKQSVILNTGVYTQAQYDQYKDLLNQLKDKSTKELQNILAANNQTKTGQKPDLILKIADGKVLGQIPRCKTCFGGRLRFNYKTGIYQCPGFQDDDHFKHCNAKFNFDEIQRTPWQDI